MSGRLTPNKPPYSCRRAPARSTILAALFVLAGQTPVLAAGTCTQWYWVATAPANWSGFNNGGPWSSTSGCTTNPCKCNAAPSAGKPVVFDGGGLGTCNIDVSISASSITVGSGFTGTINVQNSANSITISSMLVVNNGTLATLGSSATVA